MDLPNKIILYIYSYLNEKEEKQTFKRISKRFYNLFLDTIPCLYLKKN